MIQIVALRVLVNVGLAALFFVFGLLVVSVRMPCGCVGIRTPGRLVETVPWSLAVSATPSPFLLCSECFEICNEWWVSALDIPFCLPDISFWLLVSALRGSAWRC